MQAVLTTQKQAPIERERVICLIVDQSVQNAVRSFWLPRQQGEQQDETRGGFNHIVGNPTRKRGAMKYGNFPRSRVGFPVLKLLLEKSEVRHDLTTPMPDNDFSFSEEFQQPKEPIMADQSNETKKEEKQSQSCSTTKQGKKSCGCGFQVGGRDLRSPFGLFVFDNPSRSQG